MRSGGWLSSWPRRGVRIDRLLIRPVSQGSVGRVMRPLGGVIRPDLVEVPAGRLSLDDRIEIKLGLDRGDTFEVIGARIGRHRSTVCREIQSFERGRDGYQPTAAHRRALQRWKRPKSPSWQGTRFCVSGWSMVWSGCGRRNRSLTGYVPSSAMIVPCTFLTRRSIDRCMCKGVASYTSWRHVCAPVEQRAGLKGADARGKIPGMVMISQRPAEVAEPVPCPGTGKAI